MTMIFSSWLFRYVYYDDDLDEVVDDGDDHSDENEKLTAMIWYDEVVDDGDDHTDENEKLTAMTVTTRGPGALLLHHKSSPTMLHHQHYIHQDITTKIFILYNNIYYYKYIWLFSTLYHKSSLTIVHHQHYLHQDITTKISSPKINITLARIYLNFLHGGFSIHPTLFATINITSTAGKKYLPFVFYPTEISTKSWKLSYQRYELAGT